METSDTRLSWEVMNITTLVTVLERTCNCPIILKSLTSCIVHIESEVRPFMRSSSTCIEQRKLPQ